MDITASNLSTILKRNFSYEIVNTPLGSGVKLDAIQGFIYSTITGSGYLNNPIFPFSPKGLMKIFHTANRYETVTGMFDKYLFKYTPKKLSVQYPFLFNADKILIPIEVETERKYQAVLDELYNIAINTGNNPENFIIQRIEVSKKGNGMEPFMEFLACEHFKRNGYVTENQTPLSHSFGSPDFMAFKIDNCGIHIIELALLFLTKQHLVLNTPVIQEICVGEAKTSTTQMEAQLAKYAATGYFDKCFEIHPQKKETTNNTGLITLQPSFQLSINPPLKNYSEPNSQTDYKHWLQNYIKAHLLTNLSDEELVRFYKKTIGHIPTSSTDFYNSLNNINYDELINLINKG